MAEKLGASEGSSGKGALLYERLKSDLLSGRLSPGQRLSEASLSREYGVSRSPVREATGRLEHDGLVERLGMVVRVRKRSFDEIIDIYRARIFLESAIAADAASRRRDVDLLRLEWAYESEGRNDPSDSQAVVAANRAFHHALVVASHNVTLRDLQERLTAQIATMPATTLSHPGRWEEARDEHARILKAVREGDAAAASSVAHQHMSRARDIRLSLYDER
jgi:DNA-binding GntR family transcriptional regulator